MTARRNIANAGSSRLDVYDRSLGANVSSYLNPAQREAFISTVPVPEPYVIGKLTVNPRAELQALIKANQADAWKMYWRAMTEGNIGWEESNQKLQYLFAHDPITNGKITEISASIATYLMQTCQREMFDFYSKFSIANVRSASFEMIDDFIWKVVKAYVGQNITNKVEFLKLILSLAVDQKLSINLQPVLQNALDRIHFFQSRTPDDDITELLNQLKQISYVDYASYKHSEHSALKKQLTGYVSSV